MGTPFKVISIIICFVFVFVVDFRKSGGVWYKCFSHKPMYLYLAPCLVSSIKSDHLVSVVPTRTDHRLQPFYFARKKRTYIALVADLIAPFIARYNTPYFQTAHYFPLPFIMPISKACNAPSRLGMRTPRAEHIRGSHALYGPVLGYA